MQALSDDTGAAIASRVARSGASQITSMKACKGMKVPGSRPWRP